MKKTLILCAALFATTPSFSAESPAELLKQADQFYNARTENSGAQEALELCERALSEDHMLVEAYWKAGRACHWIADQSDSKKDKSLIFQKGITYAEKAVELDPRSVEAHFWLGALYGSFGEAKGVMKSLSLIKPIRREMNAIVRLNDRYQGGGGYRVLGIVDYKVPGFAGGSKKRALEQLNKALAIDPANAYNRYYMAEYFWTMGEKEKAVEQLDALSKLIPTEDVDAPDLKAIIKKGEALRAKVSG